MSASMDQKLTLLKLGRIRQIYPSWIEQASKTNLGYAECFEQLLTEELLARQENQLRRKMSQAGFPYAATIEQFDFSARPEIPRPMILRYFDSSFITGASSLVFIGASGLGKTHLSIALGTKMVQLGYTVRFVVTQQLANAILEAPSRLQIAKIIEPLLKCDLLILDEFGYFPLEPQVGPILYELIAGRYQKSATILTSNKSLATWGELISDNALMMAILDRLLHYGEVFYLRGTSYRMRGKEPVTLLAKTDGETDSRAEKA
jgi:DNA replication protein DnaC